MVSLRYPRFLPSFISVYNQTMRTRSEQGLEIGRVVCSTRKNEILEFCYEAFPNLKGFPSIGLYEEGEFVEECESG